MIAWTRYTIKGIRDPLVGRDFLISSCFACIPALLNLIRPYLHGQPLIPSLATFNGVRTGISSGLSVAANSIFNTLFFFFILFLARVLLRKVWLANIAFIVLLTFIYAADNSSVEYWELPVLAGIATLTMFVLMRFGLLAMIITNTLSFYLITWPRTLDSSQWYFSQGIIPIVIVVLVALYGFRTSLAGRPLLPPNPT
jgi:hypothetical protein